MVNETADSATDNPRPADPHLAPHSPAPKPEQDQSAMARVCRLIVGHRLFDYFILLIILVAAALVGIETYPEFAERHHGLLSLLDKLVLAIFVLEAILKMGQHGRYFFRYFHDPWNVFDFVIVVTCFLPINASYASVLRLARVMRSLKLMTALPQLQLIVGALIRSIPSMAYVGVLLVLFFYVYAVMGVFLFRDNDPVHFCDLPRSMLTLFRVVTLEDWTDVMYINMFGSDSYEGYSQTWTEESGIERKSARMPLVGAAYFVSFVMFGTMIMLNLFIGVIINSMDEARAENEEEQKRQRRIEAGEDAELTLGQQLGDISHSLAELQRQVAHLSRHHQS